jgi:hypothetical protein
MAKHHGLGDVGMPQQSKPWREQCPHLGAYRWLDQIGTFKVLNKQTGEMYTMEQLYNLHSRITGGNDGTASQILSSWLSDPNKWLDDWEMHAHEYGQIDFYCRECDLAFYDKRRIYDADMKAFVARCPSCGKYAPYIPPLAKEHAGGVAAWAAHQRVVDQAKRRDNKERDEARDIRVKRCAASQTQREQEAASANASKAPPAARHAVQSAARRRSENAPGPVSIVTGATRAHAHTHNARRAITAHNGQPYHNETIVLPGFTNTVKPGGQDLPRRSASAEKKIRQAASNTSMVGTDAPVHKVFRRASSINSTAATRRPRG